LKRFFIIFKWLKHIDTELHKTGKRKIRSDRKRIDKCPHCAYISNAVSSVNINQHILNYHSTIEEKKLKFKYYCENCDYGCFAKPQFDKHCDTYKHKYKMIKQNVEHDAPLKC